MQTQVFANQLLKRPSENKMRGKNAAWLVFITKNENLNQGLLTGGSIRRSKTAARLLAIASPNLSLTEISQLELTFDSVSVAEDLVRDDENGNTVNKDKVQLIHSLNLSIFEKVVVVDAGVMILRNSDDLFNQNEIVVDQNKNWKIVPVTPNPACYKRAKEFLNGKHFDSSNFQNLLKFVGITMDPCTKHLVYSFPSKDNDLSKAQFVDVDPIVLQHLGKAPNNNFENGLTQFWHEPYLKLKISSIMDDINSPQNNLLEQTHHDSKNWIAIVGLSCRFPDANSAEEYWNILSAGENTSSNPPTARLHLSNMSNEVPANWLKCPVDQFDAAFFGMSPNEAILTDPQARLLLECSWEAFEDAGINPDKLRNLPVGIFYGSWLQDYKEQMIRESASNQELLRKYIANGFGSTAAKLSFFYGFTGPNIATESGCSSSMSAVTLACKSLQERECPLALAAGANLILQTEKNCNVVWAEDGICKTFDSNADGYGRGEGIGVLILKRYSDAVLDKDEIHGVIRGWASSQEGPSRSFGKPTIESEANCMRNAMKAANVKPSDVDYIEAHATGTRIGDPIEAKAICEAYFFKSRSGPLIIGSGKTNIGHTEACSGIAGILKVLLSLKNQEIPRHINLKRVNPGVDFESIPGKIPTQNVEWKRKALGIPRIAGISNFGITGTDIHMIIQEAPQQPFKKNGMKHPIHVLTISAKTQDALNQLAESYKTYLEQGSENLEDIAYTMNACRPHHSFRMAIVGKAKKEIIEKLNSATRIKGSCNGGKTKLCIIFSNKPTDWQELSKYKVLYSISPAFQSHMNFCDKVARKVSRFSPLTLLLNPNECVYTQSEAIYMGELLSCTFSIQYSMFKLWESWGLKPDVVVGHCFGELAGRVVTGHIKIAECFKIIEFLENRNGKSSLPGIFKKNSINETNEIPYISSLSGQFLDEENVHIMDCLAVRNMENGEMDTKFLSALQKAESIGATICLKIGIQAFPQNGIDKIHFLPEFQSIHEMDLNKEDCWLPLVSTLAALYETGYNIDWEEYHRFYSGRRVLTIPKYPFQRKSFWFDRQKQAEIPEKTVTTGVEQIPLFETVWQHSRKYQPNAALILQESVDYTVTPGFQSLVEYLETRNKFNVKEKELDDNINELCELYVVKAFYELGWEPNHIFEGDLEELVKKMGIMKSFIPAFRFFSEFLKKSVKVNMTLESINDSISKMLELLASYAPIQVINTCGSQLASVFQGKVEGNDVLFTPETNGDMNAAEFYCKNSRFYKDIVKAPVQITIEIAKEMWRATENGKDDRKLRILQVGALTCTFAEAMLTDLEKNGIECEYHLTTNSTKLLGRVSSQFQNHGENVTFAKLNFEEDALAQGFPSGYFDIVLGVGARNITENSLKHIRTLTKLGGMLIVEEANVREIDFIFGILEDYWQFGDNQSPKIVGLLANAGFSGSRHKISSSNGKCIIVTGKLVKNISNIQLESFNVSKKTWIIVHGPSEQQFLTCLEEQLKMHDRKTLSISNCGLERENQTFLKTYQNIENLEGILYIANKAPEDTTQLSCRLVLEPLLEIFQNVLRAKQKIPKVVVVTTDLIQVDHQQNICPPLATLWGFMRSARMEISGLVSKLIDLNSKDKLKNQIENLCTELWLNDDETEVAYKHHARLVRRLKLCDKEEYAVSMGIMKGHLFNEQSSYLIAGGKGAIGLALAKWMVSQGAKFIILVGRNPPSKTVLETIRALNNDGAYVICMEADVANFKQCEILLEEIRNQGLPPLKGIHHCAAVLADKMILQQNWDDFEYVMTPKISGAHNLHLITLATDLEFFVVHSSLSCTFGNVGQANYSASNAYLESLIDKRRSMGLKGMSVSWGQWNVGLGENLEMEIARPLSIQQGIAAMEKLFYANKNNVLAGIFKFPQLGKMMPAYEKTLLEHVAGKDAVIKDEIVNENSHNPVLNKPNFEEMYRKLGSKPEKEEFIQEFVRQLVCETLGVELYEVEDDKRFTDLGMDSLMGIEFANRLQLQLGDVKVGYVDLEEFGSVRRMSEIIGKAVASQG